MSGPIALDILRQVFIAVCRLPGNSSRLTGVPFTADDANPSDLRSGEPRSAAPFTLPQCTQGDIGTSETAERFPDRTAVYGKVVNPDDGTVLDDGLALVMSGPASYTGEDVVELSLHGSPVVLEAVLRLLIKLGARLAARGEFTRRAFLSGRFDLVQAEAVVDIIEARSLAAAQEARRNLDEPVSQEILGISEALKDIIAALEAHIDFDEEEEEPAPDIRFPLQQILRQIETIMEKGEASRIRREGINAVIAGKPNVGKSTLFNSLTRSDRVIVTPYPGTTRDLVDDYFRLGDLCFLLCDTAGIREHPDRIEEEGINRTKRRVEAADLVLAVVDGASPLSAEDMAVLNVCRGKPTIIVLNKTDLGLVVDPAADSLGPGSRPRVAVSAKTGENLEILEESMRTAGQELLADSSLGQKGAVSSRGMLLLEVTAAGLKNLNDSLEQGHNLNPEIIALELRRALASLEEITGQGVDDEILDRIFERFCVGK